MTNQRKGVARDLALGRHTGRVGSEADPIRPKVQRVLLEDEAV